MRRTDVRWLTVGLALLGMGFTVAQAAPAADAAAATRPRVALEYDASVPPVAFASERVGRALEQAGHAVVPAGEADSEAADLARVVIRVQPSGDAKLPAEGFSIRREVSDGAPALEILGGDAAGAMYGALDLAEQLRHGIPVDRKSVV